MAQIENFFLCIGAQKSGTEWFWRMFFGHPELFLTPVKEIHFFDHAQGLTRHLDDARRRARLAKFQRKLWNPAWWKYRDWYRDYMSSPIGDDWYANLFRHRLGRPFAGEVTPDYYIIGAKGFRHIQHLAPDARLLFIMRNPIERAWSQAMHHARRMRVDLAREPKRAFAVMEGAPNFGAHGEYAAAIEALRSVFSEQQLCLTFYEDVHADRTAALQQWCRFIGVGYRPEWFPRPAGRYNRNPSIAMPDAVRAQLRLRFAPAIERVRDLIGRVPPAWEGERR